MTIDVSDIDIDDDDGRNASDPTWKSDKGNQQSKARFARRRTHKHKQKDEFCQKNCNPAKWTELSDTKRRWIFNSSAAEQVNVWSLMLEKPPALIPCTQKEKINYFLLAK